MKKILILLLGAILLLSCSDDENEPEGELSIMISPMEQHINEDMIAEYEVRIENVSDLFAFSGELVFDSLIVELQSDQVNVGSIWE